MAKSARERGLRGNRRLVRDAGEGGALACQPVPEGLGRSGGLSPSPLERRDDAAQRRLLRHGASPSGSARIRRRRDAITLRACDSASCFAAGWFRSLAHPESTCMNLKACDDLARRQPRSADPASDRLEESRVSTTRLRLDRELERIFDICHGCRRCVSLCNAFPTLFDLIDESKTAKSTASPKLTTARSSTSATCATSAT